MPQNHPEQSPPFSMQVPEKGLFITGTDTEVGKTFVTASILRGLISHGISVGAYKPVASGMDEMQPGDPDILAEAAGNREAKTLYCSQRFLAPLAPPMAAELENRFVDENLLLRGATLWKDRCHVLVVEGAGGWHSPLSLNWTNADVAKALSYPVVVVAANKLGVVNHVLLTLESIVRGGLQVRAIILNNAFDSPDQSVSSNARLLGLFLETKHPGIPLILVGYKEPLSTEQIQSLI
jgi:dethiobiotin synthetase